MFTTSDIPPEGPAELRVVFDDEVARDWQEDMGVSSFSELDEEGARELSRRIRMGYEDETSLRSLTTRDGTMIIDPQDLGLDLANSLLAVEDPRLDPAYSPVRFIVKVFSPEASARYAEFIGAMHEGKRGAGRPGLGIELLVMRAEIELLAIQAQTVLDTVLEPPSLA